MMMMMMKTNRRKWSSERTGILVRRAVLGNVAELVTVVAALVLLGTVASKMSDQVALETAVYTHRHAQLTVGFKKNGFFFKKTQWVLGVFLVKQEKIGKIIQKLSNLRP